MKNTIESVVCNVCGSTALETVFDAPSLPLTGIYLNDSNQGLGLPVFDQSFMYCADCGHGQLRYLVSPNFLYDNTYTHRTSTSQIATSGNDYFYQQLLLITKGRKYKSLLEIGCNDLYLLDRAYGLADKLVGIDPIWIGKDHELNCKTKVLGRFVEDITIDDDISESPDIILSAHTFEHVQNLYESLVSLVEIAANNCLFVIEVPCFDNMVKQHRFDQVFHQHIQYISISSMRALVKRLGCRFLGHTFNYSYWGGTLLFWFEKSNEDDGIGSNSYEKQTLKEIRLAFSDFKMTLNSSVSQLTAIGEKSYGFGAAQMLPVLAYHMESDLGFMEAILDDNLDRALCHLPGVSPIIRPPIHGEIKDASVLVTALDSSRAIINRLIDLNPRRIFFPINCM